VLWLEDALRVVGSLPVPVDWVSTLLPAAVLLSGAEKV
jgi:hypothetical protein